MPLGNFIIAPPIHQTKRKRKELLVHITNGRLFGDNEDIGNDGIGSMKATIKYCTAALLFSSLFLPTFGTISPSPCPSLSHSISPQLLHIAACATAYRARSSKRIKAHDKHILRLTKYRIRYVLAISEST